MLLTLCIGLLTSCSKDKKAQLLSMVPSDASFVVMIDATEAMNQLDIKTDDDAAIGSELKAILKQNGASEKDIKTVKKALKNLDGTPNTLLFFGQDRKSMWLTFFVKNGDDFIDFLEHDTPKDDVDFDEEDGGYKVYENIAVKGDCVWVDLDDDSIDTEEVEGLRKLDKKDRFDEEYPAIAEMCLKENTTCFACANIAEIMKMEGGPGSSEFNTALSMVFDDATFVTYTATLTDKEATAEFRVLDSKGSPAKLNFPMGKIDASSMAMLNNNAPLIGAIAIDPATIQKVIDTALKFGVLSSSDQASLEQFKQISGTSCFSFADAHNGTFSISLADANATVELGNQLTALFSGKPLNFSTAGTKVIGRLDGTPAQGEGKAPSCLVGQYAGIYIDFSKISDKLLKGYDFSKFGKMSLVLGPDGQGVKLSCTWTVNKPVYTAMHEFMGLMKAAMGGALMMDPSFENDLINPFDTPSYGYEYEMMDSTAVYEPYTDYNDLSTPLPKADSYYEEYGDL